MGSEISNEQPAQTQVITSDPTPEYKFRLSQLPEIMGIQQYELHTKAKLGEGISSYVVRGRDTSTSKPVAVKIINKKYYETNPSSLSEFEMMRDLDHINIIKLYMVVELDGLIYAFLESGSRGELFDYVERKGRLTEYEARHLFIQIAHGVEHMHKHFICHRDLKLENIILDVNGVPKIIDFGFATKFHPQKLCYTDCGSESYAAPELYNREGYIGPEIDIWTLGVILYIMVTVRMPFATIEEIRELDYHFPKDFDIPYQLQAFISRILVYRQYRYTMKQLLSDSWLTASLQNCF
jgi:serine/threonine protein kinase